MSKLAGSGISRSVRLQRVEPVAAAPEFNLDRLPTMFPHAKWLTSRNGDETLERAARRAIGERLEAVARYLPLAAKKPDEDLEYVHQLRVSTRRATAALSMFADFLPKRRLRKTQKWLKRVRRAAAEARNLDVLVLRLKQVQPESPREAVQTVFEQISRLRSDAQDPLIQIFRRARRSHRFRRSAKALLKRVRWRGLGPQPTLNGLARSVLEDLTAKFFRAATADLSQIGALHQMRIHGKRLRYSMELLGGAFDSSFQTELYSTFKQVQEKLGSINDHATARQTFLEWMDAADGSTREFLSELVAMEEKQLDLACQQFRNWWTLERCSALQCQFARFLGHGPTEVKLSESFVPTESMRN